MRRGYKVGDQIVRHALVGVVDTVPDAAEGGNADQQVQQRSES
jgi:molecular chaperone GrpE